MSIDLRPTDLMYASLALSLSLSHPVHTVVYFLRRSLGGGRSVWGLFDTFVPCMAIDYLQETPNDGCVTNPFEDWFN